MPSSIDLRHLLPPVKDQGRRATCVAFAATAGHELLRADDEDLCEEFLHWACKLRDGLPVTEEGTTLTAAAGVLRDLGQPPERHWPYDDARNQRDPGYQPPATAYAAALGFRVMGGSTLTPSSASLLTALQQGSAVLLGLRLFSIWHFVAADGHIKIPPSRSVALGGHAVLVVGHQPDSGSFIVRNSWGDGWGDKGYGYLPEPYVDAHGLAAWALALT